MSGVRCQVSGEGYTEFLCGHFSFGGAVDVRSVRRGRLQNVRQFEKLVHASLEVAIGQTADVRGDDLRPPQRSKVTRFGSVDPLACRHIC